MEINSQCDHCSMRFEGNSCAAFDEIPSVIMGNGHDHRKLFPGDHEIRFEPIPDEKTPFVFVNPKLGDFT